VDIQCKRCGKAIAAADVNLEHMVAKCTACNAVFPFTDQLGAPKPVHALVKAPVALPEGWSLQEGSDVAFGGVGYRKTADVGARRLTIRWRWFKARHLFTLFFSLIWCSFLVFWYAGAGAAGAPWIFFVFPLLHVAVGVGLFYSSIAGLLNSTTLHVADGVLSIAHAPLPWRGARELPVDDIKQLYCVEKEHSSKNGTRHSYQVKLQRKSGDELVLLKGLDDRAQALFVELKVEQALGIDDVPVAGELPK
jgi:phage FluMu protein Com